VVRAAGLVRGGSGRLLLVSMFVLQTACSGGRAVAATQESDSTLTRLLAEIQPGVEQSSGIEAVRPLSVARADSSRLTAYLESQLEDQLPPSTASAITAAYARFGLVPDTLDLRALLEALLQEQVVGWYDPVTDTLFVLEHVPEAQIEVVLAHELVHALQDQRVDLDSLRNEIQPANDPTIAAQAAIEGHATFAMMEWQMGRMTGGAADLTRLPDLGAQFANLDLEALGDMGPVAVLRAAPRIIREELIFPYVGGLVFLQRAWTAADGVRSPPFGDALPASTEQVLHLDRYLAGDRPTSVTFSEPPPGGWEEVYSNGLGELETGVFLAEHLGDEARAEEAASGWDGDAYRLLRGPEGEAMVWVSVWDDEAEADEFASAARDAYRNRYDGTSEGASDSGAERDIRVERASIQGRPAVVIRDLPSGVSGDVLDAVTLVDLSES
jgi:hypothetical protein